MRDVIFQNYCLTDLFPGQKYLHGSLAIAGNLLDSHASECGYAFSKLFQVAEPVLVI